MRMLYDPHAVGGTLDLTSASDFGDGANNHSSSSSSTNNGNGGGGGANGGAGGGTQGGSGGAPKSVANAGPTWDTVLRHSFLVDKASFTPRSMGRSVVFFFFFGCSDNINEWVQ